ncbi:DUF3693 domain-containing protein [Vibrio casei]|uniref:DUF3693 domain-containing protein n=1 Tax=Vibrio casei TaxID=673372 RepID=UPI003F9BBE27
MNANELLNAYKTAKNYVQDKQIAHDLNLTPQKLSKIRKGMRYVTDSEAVFLAEGAGIDPELALLACHADRNENPNIKAMWENIAKKYNGLGLSSISMSCGIIAVLFSSHADATITYVTKCALCILC